ANYDYACICAPFMYVVIIAFYDAFFKILWRMLYVIPGRGALFLPVESEAIKSNFKYGIAAKGFHHIILNKYMPSFIVMNKVLIGASGVWGLAYPFVSVSRLY